MGCQYPPGTQYIYSYIESRGGLYDQTVMFGLQAFIKQYLTKPITQHDIDYAEELITAHGEPFNREGWQYILDKHNGYLPLKIRAAKEGSVIPVRNVLATIVNTDPKCFWLTTWVETSLLRAIWYPTTVCTQSWSIKQLIKKYLEGTGDVETINFRLHDFGARGCSSFETAGLGAAAHLVNFYGTDTITGLVYTRKYYNSNMSGFSVPAAEHSTITSWGKEHEVEAYRNMLTQFAKPGSIVAVVSDSYDIFNACESLWGTELKQQVIDSGATLVIRPDSGDPATVVLKCVKILSEKFGFTVNSKGFKVLNNVRVLQGDGINYDSIERILQHITNDGFSADNVSFGMGGALVQKVDRDTNKWAMKCSAAYINNEWVDVFKDPITDPGKSSKKGRVTLYKNENGYFSGLIGDYENDELYTVFENGKLIQEWSFDEIRENSNKE
jgi:nicotinamide phosphoribosyltransferase